ncbi:hypothetical protein ABS767_10070 [Sphingomonas sp. ST-64]|uniref:Uncharacterized protein n=1 Tax=Sphingomonas plantiphila TaxID=3163295 RepID=A0ABW8YPZ7_9SPHN
MFITYLLSSVIALMLGVCVYALVTKARAHAAKRRSADASG